MTKKSPFSRRDMLQAGGAAALLAAGIPVFSSLTPALAKAKKIGKQAPGFFRFSLGKFEITIVSDGNLVMPAKLLATNIPEAELKAFLKSNYLSGQSHLPHTNLTLINTGKKLILVDTGSGQNFQDSAGKVIENLKQAGVKPGDVDAIVITHGHPDHIWGIIDDFEETARFPSADYYINQVEWDHWTSEDLVSKLPEARRGMALGAQRNLNPVSARTQRIKAGTEIFPGIKMLETAGHTVGHTSLLVNSDDKTMLVTGDAINHAFISFEHPEWFFAFDEDQAKAAKTRKTLLDMAVADELIVVGYHLPFPGVGRVARRGPMFRWVPMWWQWEL